MKRPWLVPLIPVYAAGLALRSAGLLLGVQPIRRLRWQVISVGNLSVGGTGKTPFTIALARLLMREGVHVDVLSRGYGRQSTEVERVDEDGGPERYGDEPLLIARETHAPVYVGPKRWQAGKMAEEQAAAQSRSLYGVHLLDDGFQHRQLARTVDIVIVNSEDLGDALLPAGNLRERVGALKRARVLAVPAEDEAAVEELRRLGFESRAERPIWRFRRDMVVPMMPATLAKRRVVAFCGIARPDQFFSGLTQKGLDLAATRTFPDHHSFSRGEMEMLRRLAESTGSGALFTTAKDIFRLGGLGTELDEALPIFAVDLQVTFEDEAGVMTWLRDAMGLKTG